MRDCRNAKEWNLKGTMILYVINWLKDYYKRFIHLRYDPVCISERACSVWGQGHIIYQSAEFLFHAEIKRESRG